MDELRTRMAEFDRVMIERDQRGAEGVLDADFALVLVQPAAAVMPRARWIEVLPDYVIHEWTVEEQTIDVAGDTAAILRRVRMNATVLSADRSGIFVISDIWRRQDHQWRIWRRHSTPLSAPAMPGVAADSSSGG